MKRALIIAFAALTAPAAAQPTAFTYQGQLQDAGDPASGNYDIRYAVYNQLAGGARISTFNCFDNVSVEGGLFANTLDFGPLFSTPAPRYLQVEIRRDTGQDCANETGYTVLTPRQIITAAPYATHAHSAFRLSASDGDPAWAMITDPDGRIGIGTFAPESLLHVAEGDIQLGKSNEDWILHTRSHVNGDFLHITDADNGIFQFQRGLVIHQNGNVGVGTTAPASKLDVAGSIGASGNLSIGGTITTGTQTRWKSIHGSAFQPQYLAHPSFGTVGGLQHIDSFGTGNSGTVGHANGNDPAYFFAPLDLPHAARIVDVCVVGRDTMPGRDIVISIGKVSLVDGFVTEVATTFSSGSNGIVGVWCHGAVNEVVNNNAFVYYLRARMATGEPGESGNHWLLAARIQYTVTTPMP